MQSSGSLWNSGGVVMIPLMIFSIMTVILIGERLWFWWKVSRQQRPVVLQFLEQYTIESDAAIAHLKTHSHLPVARIFLTALQRPATSPEEFRLALETAAQQELPLLKRFQTVFETVIAVSPLLGLLGTLLGLMRVFVNLDLNSPSGLQSAGITRGIAEALISTATGLAIAILTLIFASLFRGLYRRQRSFLQVSGGQLELLYRQHHLSH